MTTLESAQLGDYCEALAWSSCGRWLAAGSISGPIELYGESRRTLQGHPQGCLSLAWCQDEPRLISSGQEGSVRAWRPDGSQPERSLALGPHWACAVRIHGCGTIAVLAGKEAVFLSPELEVRHRTDPAQSTLADAGWLVEEETLIACGYQGLLAFRLDQAGPVRSYRWQGSSLCMAVSPSQEFIATGDQDRTVHFWRTRHPREDRSAMMSGFACKVLQISWDSSSRYLATSGSSDVTLWDCRPPGPEGRNPIVLKNGSDGFIRSLAFEPDGLRLASGDEYGNVVVYRAPEQRPCFSARLSAEAVRLAWSPDGSRLAAASRDGEIQIWEFSDAHR